MDLSGEFDFLHALAVLTDQVHAVIVAVGCAHQGVDMKFLRIRITQKYTCVMIKLDDQNGALNSVIKRTLIIGAAYPAKKGVGQTGPR